MAAILNVCTHGVVVAGIKASSSRIRSYKELFGVIDDLLLISLQQMSNFILLQGTNIPHVPTKLLEVDLAVQHRHQFH